MIVFLRLLNLRYLRGQWLRAILAMVGVVIGVSVFIFVPTIMFNITDSLSLTGDDLGGNAPLEVRANEGGVDAALLTPLQDDERIAVAAPLVTGGGLLVGQSELLGFIGLDPQRDPQIREYDIVDGAFLSGDGQALLNQNYAQEKGYNIGDSLSLISTGGVYPLEIVGLLADTGVARLNNGDLVLMSATDAIILNGKPTLESISLVPAEGQDIDALKVSLQSQLGESVIVDTPASRYQSTQDFMTVMRLLLANISIMMLGFGSLLIYNTMAISVAQRRSEIGILRALGMERSRVRWLYVAEAGVLGFFGAIIGIGVGYVLLQITPTQSIIPKDFIGSSLLKSQAQMAVPLWLIPLALIMGTIVPMLAGFFPSRAASNVDPIEAMVQIRAETGRISVPRWRWVLAVGIVSAAILVKLFVNVSSISGVMLFNAFLFSLILAVVLLYAPVLALVGRVLPQLMQRLFGVHGMIASTNLTRRPKRMITIGILLMCGIFFGVFIGQSNFGYSDFVDNWNRSENIGQLTVAGAGANAFAPLLPIPQTVVEEIQTDSNVQAVIAENLIDLTQGDLKVSIRALDTEAFVANGGQFVFGAGNSADALPQMTHIDKPTILFHSSTTVMTQGLTVGATLPFTTPNGIVEFTVGGWLLGGVSADKVVMLMDRTVYQYYWNDAEIDRLSIVLKPSADVQEVRREWLRQYALQGVMVYDSAEMRAAFAERMNSIMVVSSLLSSLSAIVILVGAGSTLYVAILDRRREIGMLRSLGMLRYQIIGTVILEIAVMFSIGTVIGVPMAFLFNAMQQGAIQQLLGIQFSINLGQSLYLLLVLFAMTLAATYLPALVAGRTNILDAMRYE